MAGSMTPVPMGQGAPGTPPQPLLSPYGSSLGQGGLVPPTQSLLGSSPLGQSGQSTMPPGYRNMGGFALPIADFSQPPTSQGAPGWSQLTNFNPDMGVIGGNVPQPLSEGLRFGMLGPGSQQPSDFQLAPQGGQGISLGWQPQPIGTPGAGGQVNQLDQLVQRLKGGMGRRPRFNTPLPMLGGF